MLTLFDRSFWVVLMITYTCGVDVEFLNKATHIGQMWCVNMLEPGSDPEMHIIWGTGNIDVSDNRILTWYVLVSDENRWCLFTKK